MRKTVNFCQLCMAFKSAVFQKPSLFFDPENDAIDIDVEEAVEEPEVALRVDQFREICYGLEEATSRGDLPRIYEFFENFLKSWAMIKQPEYAKCVMEIQLPMIICDRIAIRSEDEKTEFDDSDKSLVHCALNAAVICVNSSHLLARQVVRHGVPLQIIESFEMYDETTQIHGLRVLDSVFAQGGNLGELMFAMKTLELAVKYFTESSERHDIQEICLRLIFRIMRYRCITKSGLSESRSDGYIGDEEKKVKVYVLKILLDVLGKLPSDEMRKYCLASIYNICLFCPELYVQFREIIIRHMRESVETGRTRGVLYYAIKGFELAFTNVADPEFREYLLANVPTVQTLFRLAETMNDDLIQAEVFKLFIRMAYFALDWTVSEISGANLFRECRELAEEVTFDVRKYIIVFLAQSAVGIADFDLPAFMDRLGLYGECVDMMDTIGPGQYRGLLLKAIASVVEKSDIVVYEFAKEGLVDILTKITVDDRKTEGLVASIRARFASVL